MDKKAIKTFAIESRKKLIEEVKYQASLLGITAKGTAEPVEKAEGMEIYDIGAYNPNTIYDEAIKQRKNLVKRINEKGFDNVVEEVAYTWFNRIIAIRFMEVNDYLPTRVRVLSSETEGKIEPDIVTEAPHIDLDFTREEIEQIYQLKNANKLDELFRLLFIKQCNKLNEILPELFEKTADYTELLLSISFTNEEGVVRQLIDNISEEDFKDQVEIIGWLYQYYNTELKNDTFKRLKKGIKISKERIPAATQLFTPDWIVRYMVENSLGRLWLEGHPKSNLKEKWKYYLNEAEQEPEVESELVKIREDAKNLKTEDIKIIDPAMGSGHILVYAFEVLMQIYTSVGYSERNAAVSILKNNLYGLDIDDRAYQLAYFAVMMKARSYNRKILNENITPQLCAIKESNTILYELIDFVAEGNENIIKDIKYLADIFKEAKNYGSIINVKRIDFNSVLNCIEKIKNTTYTDFKSLKYQREINVLYDILKQSEMLSNKYEVVITNPPYMGSSGMNKKLHSYLKSNYPITKTDLFATFIERGIELTEKNMFNCMVTMQSWMFISRYGKMRKKILNTSIITNLLHMENMVMGIAFGTSATVFRKIKVPKFKGKYNTIKLDDINKFGSPYTFPVTKNRNNLASTENFTKIPGIPIAYWCSDKVIEVFKKFPLLKEYFVTREGLTTGDNNRFLRYWNEISYQKISFNSGLGKWYPYNKGGGFRKWYGNNLYVVDWENNGYEIRNFRNEKTGKIRSHNYNDDYIFKRGITWGAFSSRNVSFRFSSDGFLFDSKGSMGFSNDVRLKNILAYLNSNVSIYFLGFLAGTKDTKPGHLILLPYNDNHNFKEKIEKIVDNCISLSKKDWDFFETSWDFKIHPLLTFNESLVESSFGKWDELTKEQFLMLKYNEKKLNDIFIEIYDLKEELSPEVKDSEITLSKSDLLTDIKSFLSYAVGCMFGRYSIDEDGLIFAGGQWDSSKYSKFIPDDDNIVPITDSEYFEDDIVGRFIEFVKVTFGKETLEENLDFIAKTLKKRGNSSREVIRNYFLTDFYKDHVQIYKKHPIYWQFDSGRNNGFKALIYMHRYEPDLVARVRTDYLHKTQKALETAIAHNDTIIDNSKSPSEKSKAVKTKNKLVKQLEETRKYDEALAHVANQKIEIDLDDGVKVNYAKFQGVEVSSEGQKAKKIDLLKTI